jgi:hypothetical protein
MTDTVPDPNTMTIAQQEAMLETLTAMRQARAEADESFDRLRGDIGMVVTATRAVHDLYAALPPSSPSVDTRRVLLAFMAQTLDAFLTKAHQS